VLSLKDDSVGDIKRVLWVLMGTIGMVLLVACANVANLLLVRANRASRNWRFAAALGAGTKGIARELLLESVALALIGGLVGLALAFGALRLLVALAPGNLPRLQDIRSTSRFSASRLRFRSSGLVSGRSRCSAREDAAGCDAARRQPHREREQEPTPRAQHAGRGAGRGGARPAGQFRLDDQDLSSLAERSTRIRAPARGSDGSVVDSRLSGEGTGGCRAHAPGHRRQDGRGDRRLLGRARIHGHDVGKWLARSRIRRGPHLLGVAGAADPDVKFVSPGYVQTMGASMVAGRDFTWTDTYGLHPVAMVSENLARELWSEPSNAVGKRIRPYPKGPWREVIGVVSDMRDDGLYEKASATAYWPLTMAEFSPLPADAGQNFVQRSATFIVRSSRTGSSGFVEKLAGRSGRSTQSALASVGR
jgi:hypothetical protein